LRALQASDPYTPPLLAESTHSSGNVLIALAGVVVLGVGAQWAAWRLHLPSILLLLLCGVLAGPLGFGFLHPDELLGPLLFPAVSLAVAVILFEGGLTLEVGELEKASGVLTRLLTLGVLITWVLSSAAAHWLAGLEWRLATLLGAILTVTGPTVVGPLLRHVRPRGTIGALIKWEGIVADVIGATLAVLVVEAILVEDLFTSTTVAIAGLTRTVAVAASLGMLGTAGLLVALRDHWVPDRLEAPLVLAVVLGVFSASHALQHESGLIAVTIMGFQLANQKTYSVRHIVEFKENLRVLLISSLFILLAARLEMSDLRALDWGSVAFVLLLILVVRPIAAFASSQGSSLSWRERVFLAWMAPRGIVAAAVSALFALRLEQHGFADAARLAPLAFLVIIGTVAIYGLTAAPVARLLGLADLAPQGILLLGAGPVPRAIAKALAKDGVRIVLLDMNRRNVLAARLAGLEAVHGNVLSADVQDEIDLVGIGRLMAMTPNDEVNALAVLHFTELFERGGVYQVVPGGPAGSTDMETRGRGLFGARSSLDVLEERLAKGAQLKRTSLSETFDFESYKAHYGAEALPMFRVGADGRLVVFDRVDTPDAGPGDVLISLVDRQSQSGDSDQAGSSDSSSWT